ncbi:hypothetical protein [Roseateles sp. L2-2]|uniref:hypothetical protein n=1 Tax=Roseateles sp. L2-2 TaxID=3422597 RepID=UPI003D3629F9
MRFTFSLSLFLALASGTANAQEAPASKCVVVFSQGSNMSPSDPQVNRMWNRLNDSFGQFVSAELKGAGQRVIEMPHPVEATDIAANMRRLLKKAQQEGCNLIVSTSMYADQQTHQFMSTLRINPITAERREFPAGTNYAIAQETFKKEQADPLTKETLDRLVASDIAKSLVGDYLNATK